ncbi:unnamed protein product [Ilex paraguariensis]|uniref:RRM domain-containing protein n=1 Tax=Ilex paraguariensis TaxID=185542 RepID=A0ABC8RSJ8_9AQUA
MAFFSKAGNILRQTVTKHINQEISASNPSVFQIIRCMSSSKIFIGGLSYSTDDTSLTEAFNKYGEVIDARVIIDRESGRSRGFGFVTYANPEDASAAIQALDGQDLHGRMVRVNYANERTRAPAYGGGGGYGSGNYGGGYGGGNYGSGGGDSYGGGSGGNYGSNYRGNSYGTGGSVGDNYAGGGSGGNYGSSYGGNNYGTGSGVGDNNAGGGSSYASGNSYGSGSSVSYDGDGQNFGVAGGVGGSDNSVNGVSGGANSFDSSEYNGNTGSEYSRGNQFGSNGSSNMADGGGDYSPDVPLEGSYRDDDDVQVEDIADRRA